jgi:membrane-associated PAP2 superfamily phosphatase
LGAGLFAGWWMGGYQMLRGDHYLSHTVVSMLICLAIFLACRQLVDAVAQAGVKRFCVGAER